MNARTFRRILLVVWVAANLTIMCQGHDIEGRQVGLHLLLLDFHHNDAGDSLGSDHAGADQLDAMASSTMSDLGANTVGASYSPPLEAFSASTLGLTIFLALALKDARFQALEPAEAVYSKSQVGWQPEPPPPRLNKSNKRLLFV